MNERGDEIALSRTELPVKPNCTTAGITSSEGKHFERIIGERIVYLIVLRTIPNRPASCMT